VRSRAYNVIIPFAVRRHQEINGIVASYSHLYDMPVTGLRFSPYTDWGRRTWLISSLLMRTFAVSR